MSLAVGPVVGGVLVHAVGWRSVFWVNLPVGVAALLLTARSVPESRAVRPQALDPVGQGLLFFALAGLTAGVIKGPRAGWGSAGIVGLFATAGLKRSSGSELRSTFTRGAGRGGEPRLVDRPDLRRGEVAAADAAAGVGSPPRKPGHQGPGCR